MATCCSFLVAYPFRKPFYTNSLFTGSALIIFIFNVAFLVLPAKSWFCTWFDVQQFTGDYEYKYTILAGILANTVITVAAEKLIAVNITQWFDKRAATQKTEQMDRKMLKIATADD